MVCLAEYARQLDARADCTRRLIAALDAQGTTTRERSLHRRLARLGYTLQRRADGQYAIRAASGRYTAAGLTLADVDQWLAQD